MTIDVKDYFGNKLIYRAASGLEKAMVDVGSFMLLGNKLERSQLEAELIVKNWRPYETQLRNLPFLAWAYDVDLWEDGWSEATQREWVARQWEFKTKRGSIDAIRMALDFAGRGFVTRSGGYYLINYVTPPQDFWVSPDLSVDEWNSWIKLMPEVRVYVGGDVGTAFGGDEFYLSDEASWTEAQPVMTADTTRVTIDTILHTLDETLGRVSLDRTNIRLDSTSHTLDETRNPLVPTATGIGAPVGCLDIGAVGYDDGWELYGRRAILRQAGHPDVRLKVIQRETITDTFQTVEFEDVHVPGISTLGLFVTEDALGEDKFLGFDDLAPQLYRVQFNSAYDSVRTQLHLSEVVPTLEPISVTFNRNSDIGDAGPFMYLDDTVLGEDFIESDNGALMLADYMYLLDPKISTPMQKGISFLDIDRLGAHPYQMELMIDLRQQEQAPTLFIDDGFLEQDYYVDEDPSHIDRARRGVIAAKSLRDKALLAFNPLRQLEATDTVTSTTRISDWVPNEL